MFKGSFVSLITPFDDRLRVDESRLRKLLSWHLMEGTEGFVVGGSAGEGSFLSAEETEFIAQITLDVVGETRPVLLEIKERETSSALYRIKKAQDIGLTGIVVSAPPFLSESAVFHHFYQLSKVQMPLVIAHEPLVNGVRLKASLISELAALPMVSALCESSNLEDVIDLCDESQITFLCGRDQYAYPLMQKGAQGIISVAANVFPRLYKEFIDSCLRNNQTRALFIEKRCQRLHELFSNTLGSAAIKYAVMLMNRGEEYRSRYSLASLVDDKKELIRKEVERIKDL